MGLEERNSAKWPVTIYTRPGCTTCRRAKRFLVARGIAYTEIDVAEDSAARRWVTLRAGGETPVVVVEGEVMVGFDWRRLERLLGVSHGRHGRLTGRSGEAEEMEGEAKRRKRI